MKLEQIQWTKEQGWSSNQTIGKNADLVLVFGESSILCQSFWLNDLKQKYPTAILFGCSTAGEIQGPKVYDGTLGVTAIQFKNTKVKLAKTRLSKADDSFEAGKKLAHSLEQKDLSHVLVLSVGLNVNGSELVAGLTSALPKNVLITGGLAGDQDRFKETFVVLGENVSNDEIGVVGFYGNKIKVRSASLGGWESFGKSRKVTRAHGNVLYELDGQSALDIYKTLLGDQSKHLPGSALFFPLSIQKGSSNQGLVRTILSVDEGEQSMTFAGDIPEGSDVKFMKANFSRLLGGAAGAAEQCAKEIKNPDLAILISCVGRKLVLKDKVVEEVLAAQKIFGEKTFLTGFYSYGEISPYTPTATCELHNQTMTITTFEELE